MKKDPGCLISQHSDNTAQYITNQNDPGAAIYRLKSDEKGGFVMINSESYSVRERQGLIAGEQASKPERGRSPKNKQKDKAPLVGIIMGSDSDLKIMENAALVMEQFSIPYEVKVVSAHRTPERMFDYAKNAQSRGVEVIVAGAGGAAHLPGMVASLTPLPVIGVPVKLKELDGLDSLLSIVQMPGGVPVATVGINNAKNAGLLAARILGIKHRAINQKLVENMLFTKENLIYDLEQKLKQSWTTDDTNYESKK